MNRRSFLLSRGARLLQPLLLLLAVAAYWRGHHLPGGGFIAGLIAAAAFTLRSLGDGVPEARRSLRWEPLTLATAGLAVALTAGLLGLVARDALLAGLWVPEFRVPLLGVVHLGTPMLFDLGVFLTVTGFTTGVAFALQEDET